MVVIFYFILRRFPFKQQINATLRQDEFKTIFILFEWLYNLQINLMETRPVSLITVKL